MKLISLSLIAAVLTLGVSQKAHAFDAMPILIFPNGKVSGGDVATRSCAGVATPCPDVG